MSVSCMYISLSTAGQLCRSLVAPSLGCTTPSERQAYCRVLKVWMCYGYMYIAGWPEWLVWYGLYGMAGRLWHGWPDYGMGQGMAWHGMAWHGMLAPLLLCLVERRVYTCIPTYVL